jgi:hypothetical protein
MGMGSDNEKSHWPGVISWLPKDNVQQDNMIC